jgi:hypothetical protein
VHCRFDHISRRELVTRVAIRILSPGYSAMRHYTGFTE